MSINLIPEALNNFNVYDEFEKIVGISGEVTLPKLEAMTETMSGAGILGEYESPTPGHFKAMDITIPFTSLMQQTFNIFSSAQRTLTLRGSVRHNDIASGTIINRPLKVVVRGPGKTVEPGKLAVGSKSDSSAAMEVLYIKIEENGHVLIELDKLNFIFVVDGVDQLAAIRSQI